MKPIFARVVIALVVAFAVVLPTAAQTNKFHALVLAERGEQHEPFVVAALEWLTVTAPKEGFTYDVFEKPEGFTKEFLSKYQVFIQLNYPPYRWSDEAKAAFIDYVENGRGGWVGMHHATLLGDFDGYPMWNWFSGYMGKIKFKNYIAERVSGTVHVEDSTHPAFKGLPAKFVIAEEEWYTFDRNPRPNIRVLANVDESSYKPDSKVKMGDHPVVWTNEKMKARNLYMLMGHHPTLLKNENFTMLLKNSIIWAAGTATADQASPK